MTADPQVDASLAQLGALGRRGHEIRQRLARDGSDTGALAASRVWQHDCAALVSQLSGGSKAHWLSRAYSAALLVRAGDGGALVEARVEDIVSRVLDVLDRAAQSLRQPDAALAAAMAAAAPPAPRRFDFVRHEALRPVLEQAYVESGRALDEGDYTASLKTTCSIIEALLTDALSPVGAGSNGDRQRAALADVVDLSFEDRIAAAERAGLIRGGCARLPPAARAYRAAGASAIVTPRDARVARQVLHVVLRDLDPGR
jgi:hypothetical protein